MANHPEAGETQAALQDDFTSMMQEIQAKSPVLYRQLQKMPRKQALSAIFRALSSGVIADDDGAKKKNDVSPKHLSAQNFSAFLPDKRLFYYRADRLNYNDIRNVLQKYERIPALILDLRTASGTEYNQIIPIFEYLHSRNMPVAILTAGTTSGAPALFCAYVRKDNAFVTIGQPWRNQLYPCTKVSLSGSSWQVPLIAEEFALIPPEGSKPQITYKNGGSRIEKNGLQSPDLLSKDGLLTFAGDFLISRLVLSIKK
ncbi:MAG: hypothetical protein IKB16_01400 [Lentisphaeria bacterium]|nr:hypothetical protein [Lentisphaeria bacterium]